MTIIRRQLVAATTAILALAVGAGGQTAAPGSHVSEIRTIQQEDGSSIKIEAGVITVPENRSRETGRVITIPYERLRSTSKTPGPPVFILAGGPGSSGIANLHKDGGFQDMTFYRAFADVVVFDQRGAGGSTPELQCDGRAALPPGELPTHRSVGALMRICVADCREQLENRGIDLTAYNTDESAADVNDLRRALGYKKIILVGGSYGSHLGLHVLRTYPEHVGRALFYGIEGPDHTYDVPSECLATLERIAGIIEASDAYAGRIPEGGLIGALRTVLDRVRRQPVTVTVHRGDQEIEVVVNELVVQAIADRFAGDRRHPARWPDLILAMYDGDFALPARAAMEFRSIPAPEAMKYMMDCSSGISDARRRLIETDPAGDLLGFLNMDYRLMGNAWGARDLGDAYRVNVESDIPVLLIHGTWDTSTPIENARDVVASLPNGHLIEVIGGRHGALCDLYKHWPPARETIRAFLTGENPQLPATVEMPPLEFPDRDS